MKKFFGSREKSDGRVVTGYEVVVKATEVTSRSRVETRHTRVMEEDDGGRESTKGEERVFIR